MRIAALIGLVGLAGAAGWFVPDLVAGGSAPAAAASAASADEQRAEIERILREDLQAGSSDGNAEVLAGMEAIQRGQAPDDFWDAYQAHVGQGRRVLRLENSVIREAAEAAEELYWDSYRDLVKIARRYGADTREAESRIGDRG